MTRTDAQLIGSPEAFRELYERYAERIHGYHIRRTRKPDAAHVQDFKGTFEPTVDATKHVNGGCRSLDSAGLHWECFLGRKAVDEQILSGDFLGEYAPDPGHGWPCPYAGRASSSAAASA
jgi:hypothetical protein